MGVTVLMIARAEGETGFEIFADNAVTARILNIVSGAKETVVLVSPYIDQVGHVEQELLKAKNRHVELSVIVRRDGDTVGGRNSATALAWLKEHDIQVLAVPNLHAKFYLNEKEGVISSMNLLRSSWSGSLELGISVTGEAHRRLLAYLRDTVGEFSEGIAETPPSPTGKDPMKTTSRPDQSTP